MIDMFVESNQKNLEPPFSETKSRKDTKMNGVQPLVLSFPRDWDASRSVHCRAGISKTSIRYCVAEFGRS